MLKPGYENGMNDPILEWVESMQGFNADPEELLAAVSTLTRTGQSITYRDMLGALMEIQVEEENKVESGLPLQPATLELGEYVYTCVPVVRHTLRYDGMGASYTTSVFDVAMPKVSDYRQLILVGTDQWVIVDIVEEYISNTYAILRMKNEKEKN